MINRFSAWQDSRIPWAILSFVSIALVIFAHSFFQNYLYMLPCEQCVYIRFAFLCMALGGILSLINPKNFIIKIISYTLAIWGAVQGVIYSLKLAKIHTAIRSDEPFGVQGCSTEPHYPFGLPLEKIAPDWFLPTGDCGYDSPMVLADTQLSSIQSYFINLYSDGWYLVPSRYFLSMADCTLFGFGLCLVVLLIMFASKIITIFQKSKC